MRKSEAVCENERAGQGMPSHLLLPVHDGLCVSGMQQGTGENTFEDTKTASYRLLCDVEKTKRNIHAGSAILLLSESFCGG